MNRQMSSSANKPSAEPPFRIQVAERVTRLPPYLFGRINALLYNKRRAGDDVIDLGMGNPSDPPEEFVIEKLAAPTGQSRGLGFTARTMETFDQRGILPLFGPLETSPLGHFGGVQFDYSVLEDGHFGARGIPQSQTEAVLERWATGKGADIRRSWELVNLVDDGTVQLLRKVVDRV